MCNVEDRADSTGESVHVSLEENDHVSVLLRTAPSATIHASFTEPQDPRLPSFKAFARMLGHAPLEAAPKLDGFVFERLPLGRYEVYLELPGTGAEVTLEHDGQIVEVELSPPSAVFPIGGKVVDQNGVPLIDIRIDARPSDLFAQPASIVHPFALTNEFGEFALAGLPPGSYDLHAAGVVGEAWLRAITAGATGVEVRMESQADNKP